MIHVVISQHFNMLFMYIYTHVHQKINKKFLQIGTTLESHFSIGQAGFEKKSAVYSQESFRRFLYKPSIQLYMYSDNYTEFLTSKFLYRLTTHLNA